jgi:hypothetical protein
MHNILRSSLYSYLSVTGCHYFFIFNISGDSWDQSQDLLTVPGGIVVCMLA